MRRPSRVVRVLSALLPAEARRDLFEPAIHDLHAESARTGRGTGLASVLVFLECWRLAPSEVFAMFLHDVRHALRLLVREPGFTLSAILTLGLGVGANVAVFVVVNAVLLRPLPFPDADRLVLLQHRDQRTGLTKGFIAIGDFIDLHARQQSFDSLGGFGAGPGTVYGEGEPFDVSGLMATSELLDALRMRPALGRSLTPDDSREGAAPVALLGYDLWQQRFGGNPAVIGRAIRIGPVTFQVVGVGPPGFRFPQNARTDVIVPIEVPVRAPAERKSGWTFGVARLKPGVTLEKALADLSAISRQMAQEHPAANQGSEYFAVALRDWMVGDTKRALLLLLSAVSLVMLIACVNVANLLVARAVGRRQEMAVRVAMGAGRSRLIAQWLTESLVLAVVAGAAGIGIARWTIPVLVAMVPPSQNLPALVGLGVDRVVLAFTGGLTLLTTVVFGVIPALGIRIDNAVGALVNPGRVTAGAAVRRASSALGPIGTAPATDPLGGAGPGLRGFSARRGAGLVLRSFSRLLAVDPGFRTDRVLTFDIALPADRYREAPAREAFYARAFDALRRLDGVESAGAAVVTPLTGNNWTVGFNRSDRPVPAGQRPPDVGWQAATGGYFSTLQIPLRAGRLFDARDRPGGPPVVIISEAIRDRFFPGDDPIGRKVRGDGSDAEIVGVVGNIRRASLTDQPRADMYFPIEQAPQIGTTLFVRTRQDPMASLDAVRAALRGIEPQIMMREITTMDAVTRESAQVTRLALSLLGVFAIAALGLAGVGIYGVMSYSVRQRTREIGTRLALGATGADIVWLVMRDGLLVAALGGAIGVGCGLAAARALSALLYGTSPADPLTLGLAVLILLAVAVLACYLPARRATRVDPVRTLVA